MESLRGLRVFIAKELVRETGVDLDSVRGTMSSSRRDGLEVFWMRNRGKDIIRYGRSKGACIVSSPNLMPREVPQAKLFDRPPQTGWGAG